MSKADDLPFDLPSRPTNYDLGMLLGIISTQLKGLDKRVEQQAIATEVRFAGIENRLSVIEPPVLAMVRQAEQTEKDRHDLREKALLTVVGTAAGLCVAFVTNLSRHLPHLPI